MLHCPFKKADSWNKPTTGSTSTSVLFLDDIPSLCHNFSHTFDPKMHHPAMDAQVLSLQCGISCPLRTAALSLKLEYVVPEGLI